MTDFELMGAALDEARKAAALGEVPVGAVVARNGQIVAAAHNTRETEKNALHHAELLAIDAHPAGGVRRGRCQGRVLRQCDGPVCPAVQPPPDGGAGPAGRRSRSTAAGVFQGSAGAAGCSAEVETARTARREYEETVKKWKLRGKVSSFHFLFSANCAILFNGILSKPI